jgi:Tol biopolymer transport system component
MLSRVLLYFFILFVTGCLNKPTNKITNNYASHVIASPEIFAEGIISQKRSSEFDICFSPDGLTAFFTRRSEGGMQKIWQSTFNAGQWTIPVLASFSTDRDEMPFVSPDGKTIYFGSTRPIDGRPGKGGFDMNIWKADWSDSGWNQPQPLDAGINAIQEENEQWPSSNENFIFTLNNLDFIYATMLRGTEAIDIYQLRLKADGITDRVKISGLFANAKVWKYSPVISPDGNYLFFNSYGLEGGMGAEDIYVSRKTSTGWSEARNIGSLINTVSEESSPRFSPDGRYFFFAREIKPAPEVDGTWDIYFVETRFLELEKLFQP